MATKYKMNRCITLIEVEFDESRLIDQALNVKGYETFLDPKNGNAMSEWQICRISSGYGYEIAESFKKQFDLKDCRPRFYIQESHSVIPFHVDRGTLCSLNIVLSDDPAPITFRTGDIYYKSALLNTQEYHAVRNGPERRILYKISIFDRSYGDMLNVLPSKLSF